MTGGRSGAPLITVISATLNRARQLPRCIRSIAAQSYPHREYIVMDGGSTDGTVDILRAAPDVVTYWETSPDRGIYHAWNKALPHARGDWICFLGADDYLWSPQTLERVARAAAARRPETRIIYGRVALVNPRDEVLDVVGRPWRRRGRASQRWFALSFPAVFMERSLLAECGAFDETFRIAGDWDMLVRATSASEVEFLPEVLVAMEMGGISSASTNEPATLHEILKIWRKHGLASLPTPAWLWLYAEAAVRGAVRRAVGEPAANQVFDAYRRIRGKPALWTRR